MTEKWAGRLLWCGVIGVGLSCLYLAWIWRNDTAARPILIDDSSR